MATYFSGAANQREMPALCSRDAGSEPYPSQSIMGNLLYLNHPSSGAFPEFTGIAPAATSQDSSYSDLKDGRNEMFMQMIGASQNGAGDLIQNPNPIADETHLGMQLNFGILNGQNLPLQQANFPPVHGQGLSLSLGTHIMVPPFQYAMVNGGIYGPHGDDDARSKFMHSEVSRTISNSKYLKAAQELLDEVVNVRKDLKQKVDKNQNANNNSAGVGDCKESDGASKSDGISSNSREQNTQSNELSPSERQELQNKLTKLLAMLDQVDRRYKHYYHQMQIVVSSFDVIAGSGSAKPYTAVALQTISRHFRCLKDTINDQIRSIRKGLGEEESSASKGVD
uniref:POX domain-containing protein n=1 Tax=Ananas comosus var. bracteatus TaxID=296719 RepID=A0A6V7PAY9_ANACO|nr:unnamed protein product [Ananas comosus var. bracteatus]